MASDSTLDAPALSFFYSLFDPGKLPPAAMAFNHSANPFLAGQAFWGPVTATLDWCEANYQFSRYIAEAANTFSNIFTVALAVYGAAQSVSEKLPPRYLAGYAGFALVGIGSFIFHATLLFEAQLMDELPMIYVASYCCAILFDTSRGFSLKDSNAKELGIIFAVFNVLFTWSYYVSRNPLYHQFVFAGLLFVTTFRTIYLLRNGDISKRLPQALRSSVARLFSYGAGTFAFGFLVWNLDNIFCSYITRWKNAVGWPAAFLLEGHSWWHILTALGTYLMLIGNTYLTLCIKDDYSNYTVARTAGFPRIKRLNKTKTQ
ncbi:alkaline phytoceramidase [Lentinus tigrinus ALCF2SS1-6]|uniref:Alkaline phytoceramidase n=1 Tax=Lentinus tigrinus ALCF2SS1-6 TaxID=1328759 RepID=A0A5C2S151_9APHY|nr:alkaline phytoceramidase [Lentinus tigrinus ALCF2SS1-6]